MSDFRYKNLVYSVGFTAMLFAPVDAAVTVSLSQEEIRLYELVNEYRVQKGVLAIPLSVSLTYVAQTHVQDLQNNPRSGDCNAHSWSENGSWTPCCYTAVQPQNSCVALKPIELTSYPGQGIELTYPARITPVTGQSTLAALQKSSAHNGQLLSPGNWNALGVGIYGSYAAVWMGMSFDPAGSPDLTAQTTTPPAQSDSGSQAIIRQDFSMHIPDAVYQSPNGNIKLWVDLESVPSANGDLLFKLKNYGLK